MDKYESHMAARPGIIDGHWVSTSGLDAASQFKPYFHGPRIKVANGDGEVRFGTVGMTGGWQPVFLLMHRCTDLGSWDTLGPDDKILAIKVGSHYKEVKE